MKESFFNILRQFSISIILLTCLSSCWHSDKKLMSNKSRFDPNLTGGWILRSGSDLLGKQLSIHKSSSDGYYRKSVNRKNQLIYNKFEVYPLPETRSFFIEIGKGNNFNYFLALKYNNKIYIYDNPCPKQTCDVNSKEELLDKAYQYVARDDAWSGKDLIVYVRNRR